MKSYTAHIYTVLCIGLGFLLFRYAWVSDDAFITLRSVDNFLHGHGLRWNISERVQSYSHPLWMLLLIPTHALVTDPYQALLGLGFLFSAASVAGLMFLFRHQRFTLCWILLCLSLSRAFIDFSSSGLENPLSHFLLILFFHRFDKKASTIQLVFLASLILLTRLDHALLIAPSLFYALRKGQAALPLRHLPLAISPLLIWSLFSVVYYGTPFPNTAYAKLSHGLPVGETLVQGIRYLWFSFRYDPMTSVSIYSAIVVGCWSTLKKSKPISLGLLLFLSYQIKIGGDFMVGRFLTAPFVIALYLLATRVVNRITRSKLQWPAMATPIFLGLLAAVPTWNIQPLTQEKTSALSLPGPRGIIDERLYYQKNTGLWHARQRVRSPNHPGRARGELWKQTGPQVLTRGAVGMSGYYAGPDVHLVDINGLADPLLARLPAQPASDWRIGHFKRALPEGYIEHLMDDAHLIQDPVIRAYYEKLHRVTREPLFSRDRWLAIVYITLHPSVGLPPRQDD